MAEVKTIKDVDDETWATFKSLASKNQMKLGPFFKSIVKEYEKSSANFWYEILKGEKILSDKEAEDMKKVVQKSRKEYGFR